MKKEELVNIISGQLSAKGRETAVAFDIFLQKVSESLEVNESVKIPEIGIFQLKKRSAASSEDAHGKSSFYLLHVPLKYNRKDKNEVLAFQVNPRNIKRPDFDDDVFSLSVDQPLIPVTAQARKDFLVHSSYVAMQKNFEDRVQGLLLNSVNLSDFDIDYNISSVPDENRFDSGYGLTQEVSETDRIPWDFGEEEEILNDADPDAKEIESEAGDEFDDIVAKITDGITDEIPDLEADFNEDILSADEAKPATRKKDEGEIDDLASIDFGKEMLWNEIQQEAGMSNFPEDILNSNTELKNAEFKPDFQTDFNTAGPQPEAENETEDILKDLLPDDKAQVPDELFKDLLGEDELPNVFPPASGKPEGIFSEISADGELGDDWFSLKETTEEEEPEAPAEEKPAEEEEPLGSFAELADPGAPDENWFNLEETADNFEVQPTALEDEVDNIDSKLELLTDLDAGLSVDPFSDFALTDAEATENANPEEEIPGEEEPVDELNIEELAAEEEALKETPANEAAFLTPLTEDKMLEDEEEPARKSKYPPAFWAIAAAIVLVTLGGGYYFFFMGKTLPSFLNPAKKITSVTASSEPSVKAEIIERDYSIPVTVYERSRETASSQEDQNSETEEQGSEVNAAPENQASSANAVKDNKPEANTPPAKAPSAAVQNAKPENKNVQTAKPKATGTPDAKSAANNFQTNNPQTNKNQAAKPQTVKPQSVKPQVNNLQSGGRSGNADIPDDASSQLRSDTKNRLIKESIFTDGKGRYTIQESSWMSRTEAAKRAKHFRSQGLDAYVTKYAPKGGKTWYRVRIGDYSSLEETENTLKRLK